MADHISLFAHHLADRRGPRTVTTYVRTATALAEFLGVSDYSARIPTRADVEAFLGRARLDGRRRSAAGRNQELAALRALAAFGHRDLGWATLPTDGIAVRREPPRDPPVLTTGDLGRLFETAGHIADPPRRALALAILAVLSQAALRVHEAVALDVSQVDLEGASLLAVRGKGGSVHDLPLNPPTVELLRAWLARRRFLARDGEPALLISVRGTRLSIRSVQHLLTRLGLAMDLQKRLSPHVLRHTAATLALSLGTDVSTVGDLLRHADLNVTRRYLHLVDTRKREAVSRMGSTIPVSVLTHPALISGGVSAARPGEPAQLPSDSGTFPLDVQLPLDAAA